MTDLATRPLPLVTGVGPGTGAAIARRFAGDGYRVAMLARPSPRASAAGRLVVPRRGPSLPRTMVTANENAPDGFAQLERGEERPGTAGKN